MDIPGLIAFIQVAQTGSFSKAAQQLFISQSAVSKRIALLESQLEQKLFDRIGRQISLTEAGQALLPRANTIVTALNDASRAMGNLSGEVKGPLSLAASHHISLHRLPPILRRFSRQYPQVALNLKFAESEVAYQGVLQGDLELALITLAPTPDEAIHAQPVWTDHLQYVVAKDHPLAQAGRLSLAQLTDYPAILPASQTFTRQIVAEQFLHHQLPLKVAMSTNYLDTIRMMVAIGLGWSLLPQTMIDASLCVLDTGSEPIQRQLGYIYHRNRTLSNGANRLLQLLHDSD